MLKHSQIHWAEEVVTRSNHIPYTSPSCALRELRSCGLPWSSQMMVRSWCQIRAGIFCFCHLGHQRSTASVQNCIFCEVAIEHSTKAKSAKHVLGKRSFFSGARAVLLTSMGITETRADPLTMSILKASPDCTGFTSILLLCDQIICAEKAFWSGR